MKRLLSFRQMKKILCFPMLFIILSLLYPTVYLLQLNSHIYTTDQIIVTLIFMLLVSIITASAAGVSVRYFVKVILLLAKNSGLKTEVIAVSSKLYRAILGGIGTIILLILLHSATGGLIPVLSLAAWAIIYLLVSLGISILTYRFELRLFNLILCVLIVINTAILVFDNVGDGLINLRAAKMEKRIVFKNKPNVYLIVIESYAGLDIRKETYGIDNAPLIRELTRNNYTIYKSYANYTLTLASLASIFLMDHHYEKTARNIDASGYRKLIGAEVYNPVLSTFIRNGYKIDYSKLPADFYHPSPSISKKEIRPLLQPIEVFGGLFLFANRVTGVDLWGSKLFRSLLYLPEKITGKLSIAEKNREDDEQRPVFAVEYTGGSNHVPTSLSQFPPEIRNLPDAPLMPSWKLRNINNYWLVTYKSRIAETDAALIERVHELAAKDPSAFVILLGDHGVRRTMDTWTGKTNDPNKNMLENGFQPSEVSRDMCEAFLAVKWPAGIKKPDSPFTHINLFRQVFAGLAQDQSILKKQVSNDSFILDYNHNSYFWGKTLYRVVKDGKLLDRWEPFNSPASQ